MRRVLRPRGLLAVRDSDCRGFVSALCRVALAICRQIRSPSGEPVVRPIGPSIASASVISYSSSMIANPWCFWLATAGIGIDVLVAWTPAGGVRKATVGYAFAIAADVVDPAGEGEGCEQRAGRVGDVEGGAERADRRFVPGAWAV